MDESNNPRRPLTVHSSVVVELSKYSTASIDINPGRGGRDGRECGPHESGLMYLNLIHLMRHSHTLPKQSTSFIPPHSSTGVEIGSKGDRLVLSLRSPADGVSFSPWNRSALTLYFDGTNFLLFHDFLLCCQAAVVNTLPEVILSRVNGGAAAPDDCIM